MITEERFKLVADALGYRSRAQFDDAMQAMRAMLEEQGKKFETYDHFLLYVEEQVQKQRGAQ
ncbi:hypothetical protein EP7_004257 [Isosphaeraceae bacterium EP7]